MHKIWAVARTEFLNAIRSKAFIISIVASGGEGAFTIW